MLAYYAFLPILGLLALLELYIPQRGRAALLTTLALGLGLFAGLRLIGIDNDSSTYSYVFDYVSNGDFGALLDERRETSQEPGYLLYLKAFYNLGFAYPATQLLLNMVSCLMLAAFLKRATTRPILGLLLYYFLFYYFRDFTQIRFCIASILSLWGLYYWYVEQKRRIALAIVLTAASFHNSSLIVVMPIFFSYLEVHENLAKIIFVSIAAIVLSFVRVTSTIMVHIFNLPEQLLRYLDFDDDSRPGMASIFLGLIIAWAVLVKNPSDRGRQFVFYALFSSFVAGMVFSDITILLRMQLLLFTAVIIAPHYLRDLWGKTLVVLVCAGALYTHLNNINEALLRPYQIWLFQ